MPQANRAASMFTRAASTSFDPSEAVGSFRSSRDVMGVFLHGSRLGSPAFNHQVTCLEIQCAAEDPEVGGWRGASSCLWV